MKLFIYSDLPSALDILAIAEVSNFTEINLNPTRKVPEPSAIAGIALVLGMGIVKVLIDNLLLERTVNKETLLNK